MKEIEKNNKTRTAIWLYPKSMQSIDQSLVLDDSKNRSEFIEKAVKFYVGYLNSQNTTSFLSETLLGAINGTIRTTENRLANNLFRLSVEMSVMMNLIASGLEIDVDDLKIMRARCVKEVRENKGRVCLEDAIEYQGS